jgi:hypothetical protein
MVAHTGLVKVPEQRLKFCMPGDQVAQLGLLATGMGRVKGRSAVLGTGVKTYFGPVRLDDDALKQAEVEVDGDGTVADGDCAKRVRQITDVESAR